jgi:pilus assembly protein CpaC
MSNLQAVHEREEALHPRRRFSRLITFGFLATALMSEGLVDVAMAQRSGQDSNAAGTVRVFRPTAADNAPPKAVSIWAAQADSLVDKVVEPGVPLNIDPQRSLIVHMKRPVTRVSVTDPEVLLITQFSPTEFELIGGKTGQVSLTFWFDEGGRGGQMVRYQVRVSPNQAVEDRRKVEYGDLEKKINELFPDSMVQLIPVADKLIVRGQAKDAEQAAQILALVRGSAGDAKGGIGLNRGAAAEPFPGTATLPTSSVINLLQVPGEMQVMLKVRVAELSRTAMRKMGGDFSFQQGDFSFESLLGLHSEGVASAVLETTDVKLVLEALATNSYGKILAEPNLVTLSGHTADFIAGGEFAVPVVVGIEGAAAATTNFRGFGTQLSFTPTVLDKDRIRLHVSPSFSTLNKENSVEGIPGLDSRAVNTTVDLREGQWLAIAGLIQDQQSGSKSRVPVIGDLPVVGSLFSNKQVKRDETELIVLVSPSLVHPMEADEAPQILPGMEVTEPNNATFYLGNRIEGKRDCQHRSTYWPAYLGERFDARRASVGEPSYEKAEGYYLQGAHGFSR